MSEAARPCSIERSRGHNYNLHFFVALNLVIVGSRFYLSTENPVGVRGIGQHYGHHHHGSVRWSRFIGQFGGVAKLGFWLSSCRQFHRPGFPVCLVRRAPGQRRMWAASIVVADP